MSPMKLSVNVSGSGSGVGEGVSVGAAVSGGALFGMFYLVIFSSCGALLFQNIGQKYTAPATAAVLLSLEAPFGVLCSILVGEEALNALMVLGFVLIFFAVICSETKFAFLRKKRVDKV